MTNPYATWEVSLVEQDIPEEKSVIALSLKINCPDGVYTLRHEGAFDSLEELQEAQQLMYRALKAEFDSHAHKEVPANEPQD